jgi:hypothetical protein
MRPQPKPTPFYHMKICDLAKEGWRKTKNGTFHGETGTFLVKDAQILFIGWSGSQILVEEK